MSACFIFLMTKSRVLIHVDRRRPNMSIKIVLQVLMYVSKIKKNEVDTCLFFVLIVESRDELMFISHR